MKFKWLLPLILFNAATHSAHAWGPEGHIIVAHIAELHLSPQATQAIRELLISAKADTYHISDDSIANWADAIRKDRPEASPWHFVDIPFDAEKYDAQRDCVKHHGCVIEAIDRFQKILADKSASPAARFEALKFVVHFVGDLHQPMHCAQRNNDLGGNRCYVQWPGSDQPANLHSVWDFQILGRSLHVARLKPLDYADSLNRSITPHENAAWIIGTPLDWAWEAHELAITKAYATIPADGTVIDLDESYIQSNQKVVDEQLKRGGIRLAGLLNQTFP